jgi:hypothetical protein
LREAPQLSVILVVQGLLHGIEHCSLDGFSFRWQQSYDFDRFIHFTEVGARTGKLVLDPMQLVFWSDANIVTATLTTQDVHSMQEFHVTNES